MFGNLFGTQKKQRDESSVPQSVIDMIWADKYPGEIPPKSRERISDSGYATTETLLLIGGLVVVVAIAAFMMNRQ